MADRLRQAGIRGVSATSLKRFRQFYRQRNELAQHCRTDSGLRRSPTRPTDFVQRCWTNPDTRAPRPWWTSSLASKVRSLSAGPMTSPCCS